MMEANTLTEIEDFYNEMPFNKVLDNQLNHTKPILLPAFDYYATGTESICEVGCGNGWLSNRIAYHYDIPVHGIDLIQRNIDQANRTSSGATFTQANLFEHKCNSDFIVSIGVLHHTPDVYIALEHLLKHKAKRLYLGLYDSQRQAVFDYFDRYTNKWEQFQQITDKLLSEEHKRSWYRDQLEHPQEVLIDGAKIYKLAKKHGYQLRTLYTMSYDDIMKSLENGKFKSGMSYFGLEKS